MRVIDLSMTIRNHWRWSVMQSLRHDFEKGDDFRGSIIQIPAHAFTHVDTPLHCRQGSVSLEKLDPFAYSGIATIVDISCIKPNKPITAELLSENGKHIKPGDLILLKTCWDKHYDPTSKEYWTEAPYMTDEAALWLSAQKPRVVGFDFPQDFPLKTINRSGCLTLDESTAHKHLLYHGVLFIEYICNLSELSEDHVKIIALPLKLEGFEGSPARVIAIEE